MGTKFANLNIRTGDPEAVSSLCPGLSIRSVVPGWVTAAGPSLEWGTVQREARRLTKQIPNAVLTTEYFDDDFAEFSVYQGGKRAARHVPAEYEGFSRVPGKPRAWADALGLPPESEKTLKAIFQETSPERCLRLLECVLGCPLWADAETLSEAAPPDPSYLSAYLIRKERERKLKNQTKLVLLDELEGDFGWHVTYPAVRREHREYLQTFWDVADGRFRQLFQRAIPGRVQDCRAMDRGEGVFLLTFDSFGTPEAPQRGETAVVFSHQGEVLDTFHPSGAVLSTGVFLDRDRVFLEGACRNFRTHRREWDLAPGHTSYSIRPLCRLEGGRLAAVYDTRDGDPMDSFLVTFSPDGSGKRIKKLPHFRHWAYPVADGGDLYLACLNRLTCYTPELEEQWSVELPEDVDLLGTPRLDGRMLYMSTYRQVTAFDLDARRVSAVRKIADGEDCYLQEVLPGVGPILMTGDASFEVWNQELRPVSRHRSKGCIAHWLRQDGHLYLLTNRAEERELCRTEQGWTSVVKKSGLLRLYELKQPH